MFLKIIKIMSNNKVKKSLLLLFTLICNSYFLQAQTVVRGFIRDAITKRAMPFVTVVFKNGKGVSTGDDGSFSIETNNLKYNALVISYVGYTSVTKTITPGIMQNLDIMLEMGSSLKEVVVKRGRGRYRNKNNPAVELIDKVIENKEKNQITSYDYVQYQQYEKLGLSLANKPDKLAQNKLFKSFKFMMENIDTTLLEGRSALPIYLEEKISEKFLRKNPPDEKTRIIAEKKVNYGDLFDQAGISTYINNLYQDINIYDNNIFLLNNQFLSPIASIAPAFYRYYIIDTTEVDGIKLIRLNFTPKNPNDLLFRGTMYITLDGNYGIQKIDLSISKKANLNWTRELKISQNFEKGADGRYHVIKSDMVTEFVIVNSSTGGIIGERLVSFKNFKINEPAPDSIYKSKAITYLPNAINKADTFWLQNRHLQLSKNESQTYSNVDSLRNTKSFKTFATVVSLFFSGFVVLNKYEIGNTNTFYSFNPVEGFRLRFGGRTTPKFNQNMYLENYIAYGFKDQQFKYLMAATYSFNNKSVYSFPLNYLKLSYQYDMKIPGQELEFVQEDNFLLSFKRGKNDKWLYNNVFKINYVREFNKNLSYTFAYKNWKQTPAGAIFYKKQGPGNETIPNITTSEISAELRWAPNEQFYQDKAYRIPIINKYPIFILRYVAGLKGLFGGEYNFQNLNFYSEKRFYLSQLGYSDVVLEGGYIFGQVPFPLLTAHRANQTYSFQQNSYNLMNFLEFVSDRYASINIDLHFNGFFLNKVPLLRRLKLREVASAKVLYGGVRDQNNPSLNADLLKFPTDAVTGNTSTFFLNNKPYIEVSVGLANIFKLLRVDLVKRLSYLNNPDITSWGIRTRIRFDF